MEIYLMRHAEAVHASRWRGSDADRPLTPMGIAKLEAGVKEMKGAGFAPGSILSSSYLRARQTADIVAKILGIPMEIKDELSSGTSLENIRKVVIAQPSEAATLLIGHMPEIAIFASKVTTEPSLLDGGLETADIVAIDPGPLAEGWGDGKLLWWRRLEDWKKVSK